MNDWLGPAAATSAALLWAVASALFEWAGRFIGAATLNMIKGLAASGLLAVTLALGGIAPPTEARAVGWLVVSGVVGLGVGDTAFFIALRELGIRRALLMMLLAPILTGLLAVVWLDEVLGPVAWAGIAVTLGGLGWVISERPARLRSVGGRGGLWRGLCLALLAAVSQSIGAIISRQVMFDPQVRPMWTALIRLLSGAVVLVPFVLVWHGRGGGRQGRRPRPAGSRGQVIAAVALATVLGTYLAVWFQQVALQRTAAGVAQTLLSLSPLFALPIAAMRGERVSFRAVAGAVVAVGGVGLFLAAG